MRNYKLKVNNLIKKYNTRNPYALAKFLGIEIIEDYFSESMPMGFFKKILKQKFIIINLTKVKSESDYNFVLAHELGHAVQHSSNDAFFLHDHTFYQRGKFEIEANKFAAQLLIDENKIDPLILENMTIKQIALCLNVPKELVEYKFYTY